MVIPHQVAILDNLQVEQLAREKFDEFIKVFTSHEILTDEKIKSNMKSNNETTHSTTVKLSENIMEIYNFYLERDLTDGFPIIPPEVNRVEEFIKKSGYEANTVIGEIAPNDGIATVREIAINSVMAGCKPEYMPIIVTVIEAMLDPKFNLRGIQTTTHPCAPLLIINGPITKQLNFNNKGNAFGQGNHANATIGRAIRLILQNIGGAKPGHLDRATQGQPSKFSYCIAENEEQNPWQALHVDFGFNETDSTVTVLGGENPHNINDHMSSQPLGLMSTISDCCCTMGMNNMYLTKSEVLICLCPEHAAILYENNWSKDDIRNYIWKNSRKSIRELKQGGMFNMAEFPDFINKTDDSMTVPIVEKPDDILIVVVGGPGKHSSFIPSFGLTRSVTRKIQI